MKWFITGGCGFIGSNLIYCLHWTGTEQMRVFDNLSVGSVEGVEKIVHCDTYETAIPPRFPHNGQVVQIIVGDIRNHDRIIEAAAGADVIVHLAANTGVIPSIEDPIADCKANVLGTVNTLEATRINGIKMFIFASSGAPLGKQEPPIHEQKVPKPLSPYGASKLAGEAYCSVYSSCFGAHAVALRFGNVYGPRSWKKGSVVAKFVRQALNHETLVIYGDGSQTRDFIYVDDLIEAICLAANCENLGGEIFQIATNQETTINEIAEILSEEIIRLTGIRVKLNYQSPRTGEVLRNFSDISKARDVLGWSPKQDLRSGLRKTIQWFIDQS